MAEQDDSDDDLPAGAVVIDERYPEETLGGFERSLSAIIRDDFPDDFPIQPGMWRYIEIRLPVTLAKEILDALRLARSVGGKVQ